MPAEDERRQPRADCDQSAIKAAGTYADQGGSVEGTAAIEFTKPADESFPKLQRARQPNQTQIHQQKPLHQAQGVSEAALLTKSEDDGNGAALHTADKRWRLFDKEENHPQGDQYEAGCP